MININKIIFIFFLLFAFILIGCSQEGDSFLNVLSLLPDEREVIFIESLLLFFLIFILVNILRKRKSLAKQAARLEEALQKANDASKAKSSFLANVSHEIRTPINAILGMAELALRENSSTEKNKHILTVKQAGVSLISIINDILDFSKIERGKMEIIPGYYSFPSLINDVISIIRMKVLDSNLRFAVFIDSNIPAYLFGDEMRIRQVLLNILGNAVKYTEKGSVSFSASCEFADDDTINISFRIQDSGKGIKPEYIEEIFNEFTKFDTEKNKEIEGVGLGLAISNGIVKAMNGSIDVHSKYGRGSLFSIKVPQKFIDREAIAAVKNPKEKSALIYERREVYINSIVYACDSLGVKNTYVTNEASFKEKIIDQSYEFIFISFQLFKNNREVITNHGGNAKVIVLTEFGETIQEKNLILLAMPVYCVSIANVINGITDNFSYENLNENIVRFTAPDARILIADDINTNLEVIQGLLLPYHMQIDLCKNGFEALKAVKSNRYDLIFLDHKMPEMDGIEVAKRIRMFDDPYFHNVPIVAFTANVIIGTKVLFLENGFDDILPKPIDTVELNCILERWIPKKKQKEYTAVKVKDNSHVLAINGLDVQKGSFRAGGNNQYKIVLNAFYVDFIEKIAKIEDCYKAGNWPLYISHIHALKGAAAMVGADELSESAKALEAAGKIKDLSYINSHNPVLIKDLKILLNDIYIALNGDKYKTVFNAEIFKDNLTALSAAIADLNSSAMYHITEKLMEMSYEESINTIIEKISDYILMGEYDQASALIESLYINNNQNSRQLHLVLVLSQ